MGWNELTENNREYFDQAFQAILEAGENNGNNWTSTSIGEDVSSQFGAGAIDDDAWLYNGSPTASPDQIYGYIEGDGGFLEWHNNTGGTVEDYFSPVWDEETKTWSDSPYDISGISDAHFEEQQATGFDVVSPKDLLNEEDVEAFESAVAEAESDLAEKMANLLLDRAKDPDPTQLADYDPNIDVGTPGQVHNRLRWSEQCFLAAATKPLADLHRAYYRPYAYIDTVDGPPNEFLNRFFHQKDSSHFVDIEPGQASELMPYFRLYKVLYKAERDEDNGAVTSLSHYDEIPIIFEKMVKEDLLEGQKEGKTFAETSEGGGYEQRSDLTSFPESPLTGYSWESFEWEFIGSNPATVRNDIKATLKLTFQDFNQLAKVRSASPMKGGKVMPYSLLDLLGYGKEQDRKNIQFFTRETGGYEDQYRPEFFEIKAVVGWNPHSFRGEPQMANIASSVSTQKIPLWLTLIDHSFDISDIGVFTLTLHYRARLEGLLSQPHACVLKSGETRTTIDDINKKILTAKKECDWEKMNDLQASLERAIEDSRKSDISSILGRLLDYPGKGKTHFTDTNQVQTHDIIRGKGPSTDGGSHPTLTGKPYKFDTPGRIFNIDIPHETILDFATGVANPIDVEKMVNDIVTGDSSADDPLSAFETAGGDLAGDIDKQVSEGEGDTAAAGSVLDKLKLLTPIYDKKEGIVTVHYFYLGDLIEVAAIRALSEENFGGSADTSFPPEICNRIKVILGSYEFYNGVTANRINLADMPISVNSFVDFWYKNVVAARKRTYPLLDFIRDIISQLVVAAMGSECFIYNGHPLGGTGARLRTAFVTLPGTNATGPVEDPLLNLPNAAAYDKVTGTIQLPFVNEIEDYDLITGKQIGDFINDTNLLTTKNITNSNHYLVVFAENLIPWDLKGDKDEDTKKGIHHLRIHKGILHSAQFRKTDAPYLRESRFQNYAYNPLVNLSNVYDVSLELLGNTLFYPGTYFFLNPLGFGTALGDPARPGSISNIMGLGGYHFIIKVNNIIDKSFTTRIQARWDNNGSGSPRSPFSPASSPECKPPENTKTSS